MHVIVARVAISKRSFVFMTLNAFPPSTHADSWRQHLTTLYVSRVLACTRAKYCGLESGNPYRNALYVCGTIYPVMQCYMWIRSDYILGIQHCRHDIWTALIGVLCVEVLYSGKFHGT